MSKAERAAAGAAFDAAMGPAPFERTAINGFGIMQVVTPRTGPSVLERAQLERDATAAVALLAQAGRETRPGPLRLVARPGVARWLGARPHLLAALALGLPVGLGWLKLQGRLKRDGRIDQLPGQPPGTGG